MIKYFKVQRKVPGTENGFGWYPSIALSGTMALADISKAIMNRCTLTEVDIVACLRAFQEEVINAMKNGYAVKLDDLGTFKPSMRSGIFSESMGNYVGGGRKTPTTTYNTDGSVKEVGVTANDIRSVGVNFFPSVVIRNSLKKTNLSFGFNNVVRKCASAPASQAASNDGPDII